MDEKTLMRLAAFIDQKTQTLEKAAEKATIAAKSINQANEQLLARDEKTIETSNMLSKHMQKLIETWSGRPIFSIQFWISGAIVSIIVAGIYYKSEITFERIGQDDKIDRIAMRVMEMSDDLKWAQSAEGKSAKELYETLKKNYNYDYAKIDRAEKKKFFDYIAKGRK
ncbi:hypothetical protein [Fundidesulfovibrio putealis]|uniref:hypothetical protein n=1 Tax=Fundidesulfovibrio putealis TaxID=270496 RepID=UPI0004869ABD|nr:hypothetical protein [Fundidesulfovibrio putealis]